MFNLAADRPDQSVTIATSTVQQIELQPAGTATRLLFMSRQIDHRELVAAGTALRAEVRRLSRELERLRLENEVLHEAAQPLIHQATAHERFASIHRLRHRFTVKRLCRVPVADRSNYYLRTRAQERRDERAREEPELIERIVEIRTTYPAYGAERITRALKRQGFEAGQRRVARLMCEQGIAGFTRREHRNPTTLDEGAATVPDLIRRRFTAPMPGLILVGDISCFPTGEGRLYLATVLDLCSKELIGDAIAPHMRASLTLDAITAAHRSGLVADNAIMPTDRGSQYHAKLYRNALRRLAIRQSTGRTGPCLDSAAAESFFATIKTEIGTAFWPDRASARLDIENWIKIYNEQRLHSALDFQPPSETRRAWQERVTNDQTPRINHPTNTKRPGRSS
jgi:transposase InsO family protein